MERREFIGAFAAAAAAAVATSAAAEDAKTDGHDHAHMMHAPKYAALAAVAAKCLADGNDCLRHCYDMLSMKDTSMADCTRASATLVAACGALATIASQNSSFTPALAKTVAEICLACKKECDKFPQYIECKNCGASCQACADECKKIAS
jgi:Cys-rich four helix bundle protein (predicted Tat secretion target)